MKKTKWMFKLKIPGHNKYWKIFVFETHEAMVKAKNKFKPDEDEERYGAIVCPFEKIKFDKDGNQKVSTLMGHVYFHKGALGAGVVSHELLHVAMNCERKLFGNKRAIFGDDIGEKEERMAHLLTALVGKTVNTFYELKIY